MAPTELLVPCGWWRVGGGLGKIKLQTLVAHKRIHLSLLEGEMILGAILSHAENDLYKATELYMEWHLHPNWCRGIRD